MRLQPLTRARVASLGAAGQAWADALPDVLTALADRWGLTLGRGLPGGSSSYVVAATRADGTGCVVKVALAVEGFTAEAGLLAAAGGRGYVRLLAVDRRRRALLLERLGRSLLHDTRPVPEQLDLLVDTLALAWRPAGEQRPTGHAAEVGRDLDATWRRLGRPGPAAMVDQALAWAEELAGTASAGDLVRGHGDPHPGNLLAVPAARPGAGTGWCFVDPAGVVAERASDLGVVLRDWSARLTGDDAAAVLRGYVARVAARSATDPDRVWRWAFLHRVATGLHVLGFGSPAVAAPLLASAERLLDRPRG